MMSDEIERGGPIRNMGRPENQRLKKAPVLSWLRIAVAIAVIAAILVLPANPSALSIAAISAFPIELPAVVLAAMLLPRAGFAFLRVATVVILTFILFLKLADLGTGFAFQRPFNPYLDLKIIVDGWNLLSGTIGQIEALLVVATAILACLLIAAILFWAMAGFRHLAPASTRSVTVALAACFLLGSTLLAISPPIRYFSANSAPYLLNRVEMIRKSIDDLAEFERTLASDPLADLPPQQLFTKLAGTDVLFIFVESYGRSVVTDQRYSESIIKKLEQMEENLSAAGLDARSSWLTSPTVAGLSWLAHGTLLSGLWTDNQARYDRMITSQRPTINALFQHAGWHTTAIMPAITMAWPEGSYFGYTTVRDASGLDYRGEPFNWVTMPDQYTLAAFERLERSGKSRPVMAEISLISSHAPWTPIPELVDWEKVGDGRIFNDQAQAGDPPSVVWADPERVRRQYRASVEYVIDTLSSYVARFGRDSLVIIVGDHQPAAIITGEGASRDVPVNIIGPKAIIDLVEPWSWQPGMIPEPTQDVRRMDEFRELFVRTFSGGR